MGIIDKDPDDGDINEVGATFIPDCDPVQFEDCGDCYTNGHRRPHAE